MPTSTLPPPPPPPNAPPPPPDLGSRGPGRDRPTPSRGDRIAWKVLASVFAVATVLWGVNLAITQLAHSEHTTASEFDATDLDVLDVRIDSGSLTVVGTDREVVSVTARISDGLRSTSEHQTVAGDRLELRASCPVLFSSFCNVDYTVEVPARMAVTARLDNDGVRLTAVEGDLDLRTENGPVRVQGSGTGTVSLASDNGSVNAVDLRAGSVRGRTSNGGVMLSFASAPTTVEARSDNGDVDVDVPDDGTAYSVATGSSNGSAVATIRTDPTSPRRIEASSDNGDVQVSYAGG